MQSPAVWGAAPGVDLTPGRVLGLVTCLRDSWESREPISRTPKPHGEELAGPCC